MEIRYLRKIRLRNTKIRASLDSRPIEDILEEHRLRVKEEAAGTGPGIHGSGSHCDAVEEARSKRRRNFFSIKFFIILHII